MDRLQELLTAYAAYHRDTRNKLTHFVGVPVVTLALFIPLAWFRFYGTSAPVTVATIFYIAVVIHYLRLDRQIGLISAAYNLPLLWIADQIAQKPFGSSFTWFLGLFVVGWIIQFIGHAFEGRRPALVDNLWQALNAPIFLSAEALFFLGMRKELHEAIEAGLSESS